MYETDSDEVVAPSFGFQPTSERTRRLADRREQNNDPRVARIHPAAARILDNNRSPDPSSRYRRGETDGRCLQNHRGRIGLSLFDPDVPPPPTPPRHRPTKGRHRPLPSFLALRART